MSWIKKAYPEPGHGFFSVSFAKKESFCTMKQPNGKLIHVTHASNLDSNLKTYSLPQDSVYVGVITYPIIVYSAENHFKKTIPIVNGVEIRNFYDNQIKNAQNKNNPVDYLNIGHKDILNKVILWAFQDNQFYSQLITEEILETKRIGETNLIHSDVFEFMNRWDACGRIDISSKTGSCFIKAIDEEKKLDIIYRLKYEYPNIHIWIFQDNHPTETVDTFLRKNKNVYASTKLAQEMKWIIDANYGLPEPIQIMEDNGNICTVFNPHENKTYYKNKKEIYNTYLEAIESENISIDDKFKQYSDTPQHSFFSPSTCQETGFYTFLSPANKEVDVTHFMGFNIKNMKKFIPEDAIYVGVTVGVTVRTKAENSYFKVKPKVNGVELDIRTPKYQAPPEE